MDELDSGNFDPVRTPSERQENERDIENDEDDEEDEEEAQDF